MCWGFREVNRVFTLVKPLICFPDKVNIPSACKYKEEIEIGEKMRVLPSLPSYEIDLMFFCDIN